MANHYKYVIVGGGRAGASAVEGIRSLDPSGSIALFGKENHLPYDRPPLSKGLWLGKAKLSELPVHDADFYAANNVHLFLGCEVTEIDRQKHQVVGAQGPHCTYEKLLLSTGGEPRRLSFGDGSVRYFRTVDDFQSLHQETERHDEFLFIGGGFIGGELAAALCINGKKVTMIFPEEFILHRVLPRDLAQYVTNYYREKGVTIVNDIPTDVRTADGRPLIVTKGGKQIATDVVTAAIGLNLHTEMAKRAGINVENGITVNAMLQSSDPDIYAAGDIAYFPAPALGKSIRIEHWNNAQSQGKHAGANMAGAKAPFTYLPYFYSDLFDLGFEAVGDLDSRLTTYADWKAEFREGVVYYLNDGRVRGVLLWNVWEKVDAARSLIGSKKVYRKPEDLRGRL